MASSGKAARSARARTDLEWLFAEGDGQICNMVAAHYRLAEAVGEGAADISEDGRVWGMGRRSPRRGFGADPYPDEESGARKRLRLVSAALRGVAPPERAILEAVHGTDGAHRRESLAYLTLEPEWVLVASMLREVVEESRRLGITRVQAARRLVSALGANEVRRVCSGIYDDALNAYVRERWRDEKEVNQ